MKVIAELTRIEQANRILAHVYSMLKLSGNEPTCKELVDGGFWHISENSREYDDEYESAAVYICEVHQEWQLDPYDEKYCKQWENEKPEWLHPLADVVKRFESGEA